MSKLKFDYIKIGPHKRPIVPVRLSYKNLAVNVPALIDSGADFNVFPLSIAKDIGLNLNMNKPLISAGFCLFLKTFGSKSFELNTAKNPGKNTIA